MKKLAVAVIVSLYSFNAFSQDAIQQLVEKLETRDRRIAALEQYELDFSLDTAVSQLNGLVSQAGKELAQLNQKALAIKKEVMALPSREPHVSWWVEEGDKKSIVQSSKGKTIRLNVSCGK